MITQDLSLPLRLRTAVTRSRYPRKACWIWPGSFRPQCKTSPDTAVPLDRKFIIRTATGALLQRGRKSPRTGRTILDVRSRSATNK